MYMQPQITEQQDWWMVSTLYGGDWFYPADEFTQQQARNLFSHEAGTNPVEGCRQITGFGARLSAPGHLDCTVWAVFPTEQKAARYLLDTYFDVDPAYAVDDEERAAIRWLESLEL